MTFICYDFKLGLLGCVLYIRVYIIPGFVVSGYCSIHQFHCKFGFDGDFVIKGRVISEFHWTLRLLVRKHLRLS